MAEAPNPLHVGGLIFQPVYIRISKRGCRNDLKLVKLVILSEVGPRWAGQAGA